MTCLLLNLLILPVMEAKPLNAGDHTRSIKVGELAREYIVHVPPSYDGKKPFPVVLVFHGGGSNAQQMIRFCGLSEKADQAGFLAVYPQGTGRLPRMLTWNAGNCCGYSMRQKVDDVAFVRALLDDLATVVQVDQKRIYATGMSNGAMISYRLASELADRIAAIAPVSGPMGTETCHPSRPVPVLHFHGTKDQFAAFEGGPGKRSISQTDFFSVGHSIQAWVKANGCPEKPKVTQLPDKADDGMTVTRKTYGPGRNGSEVVLLVIEGGGHTWPGKEPLVQFLGPSTRDIVANDLIWEFFQKTSDADLARSTRQTKPVVLVLHGALIIVRVKKRTVLVGFQGNRQSSSHLHAASLDIRQQKRIEATGPRTRRDTEDSDSVVHDFVKIPRRCPKSHCPARASPGVANNLILGREPSDLTAPRTAPLLVFRHVHHRVPQNCSI